MKGTKQWIVAFIIIILLLFCGCGQDIECEGEAISINDNSDYVGKTNRLTVENQRLIAEVNGLDEVVQQLSYEMRQLKYDEEISQQDHLLYADLMKQEGWELLETEPLDPVWTELLRAYNRFIPDFENIQELDDKELVEASKWLLYNLEFDFVEGNQYDLRAMDGVPVEYIDVMVENVFQKTIELGLYSENGIVKPKGISFDGYFHPRVITLFQKGDLYFVVLDIYVMAEDSEMEKERFLEMVEANLAKKGYSSSMILKGIETPEGRFFQILSKRTVWTESRTLPAN